MTGFTRNEESFEKAQPELNSDEDLDFELVRAEMLTLESVERRDAYDDYNRGHRWF